MPNGENRGVQPSIIGPNDFMVGSSPIPYEVRCNDWRPFFKVKELQATSKTDMQDCVSESYAHVIEAQLEWMRSEGKFSAKQLLAMHDLGLFDADDNFNISQRFIARVSNTSPTGNSQNVVAEAVRLNGLVGEKIWPRDPNYDWNQYYCEIPADVLKKAKEIFRYISIGNNVDADGNKIADADRDGGYEWVVVSSNPVGNYKDINQIFAQELKQSPIQITVPLCPSYHAKAFPCATCNLFEVVHALALQAVILNSVGAFVRYIWDSYNPFGIQFANNYPIPFGLKITAIPVIDNSTITIPVSDNTIVHDTIKTDGGQISTSASVGFFNLVKQFLTKMGIKFTEDK